MTSYEYEIREMISYLTDIQNEVNSSGYPSKWVIHNINIFLNMARTALRGAVDYIRIFEGGHIDD